MKEVITWGPTPQANNDMAAVGEIFDGLLKPQVWWNNPKSYFEASIVGRNGLKQVPGQFDRLVDAKEACEKFALGMILGATDDGPADGYYHLCAIFPGNVIKMAVIPFKQFNKQTILVQAGGKAQGLVRGILESHSYEHGLD